MPPLQNAKHERFCREYASGETLPAAYVRAGYLDSKNAPFNASRLRNRPDCRARIDELMQEFADQAALKVQYLQMQLLPALQANMADLFDDRGKLKPVTELRRELGAAIKAVKFNKDGEVSEVVLADKIQVASLLLKSIGAISDAPQQDVSVFTSIGGDGVTRLETALAEAIAQDRQLELDLKAQEPAEVPAEGARDLEDAEP